MVCYLNEYMPPTEVTQFITVKKTIYPLRVVENTRENEWVLGVDMSLFSGTMLPIYLRSLKGVILDETQYNINTLDFEFLELSTLPYQHDQIRQTQGLRFLSLVKQLPNPEPFKRHSKIVGSRIIFIVGNIKDIVRSFEIPWNSGFTYPGMQKGASRLISH